MRGDTSLVQVQAVMLASVFDGGKFYRDGDRLGDIFIKMGPGANEGTFLVRNERTFKVEPFDGAILAYPTQ